MLTFINNVYCSTYDRTVVLYDREYIEVASQIGPVNTREDVDVVDGYFIAELAFGENAFDGDARWLQIAIRPGAETGDYTPLNPLQPLNPTPYALYAKNAAQSSSDDGDWVVDVNDIYSAVSGNVGIGTTEPQEKLHIRGLSPSDSEDAHLTLEGSEETGQFQTGAGLKFQGHDGTAVKTWGTIRGLKENSTVGDDASYMAFSTRPNGSIFLYDRMIISSEGNVGIGTMGTSWPESTLHVQGGNWDLTNTEGDFKIGTPTHRLKISVATGGGGAGDVYMRAVGGSEKLKLGSGTNTVLTVQDEQVAVDGVLSLVETSAPPATSGYGKL